MALKDRQFIVRTLEFHDRMRSGQLTSAATLAREWEVSTKTVQRFVSLFKQETGAPVAYDPSRGTYYYTNPDFRLVWPQIDSQDFFAIAVAQKVLQLYEGTPAAEDMAQVYKRLEKEMPKRILVKPTSVVERLFIHPHPIRVIDPAVWHAATTSLLTRRVLSMKYEKLGQPAAWRDVEPYSLVISGLDWLLVGKDPEDDVVKIFYLNRIREAKLTEELYFIPKSFDVKKHLGDTIGIYSGGKPFRFKVRFRKEVAAWSSEVRWHPSQTLEPHPDGTLDLELPAGHMIEAKRFILAFGRYARALSPPELVDEMKQEIAAMAATT